MENLTGAVLRNNPLRSLLSSFRVTLECSSSAWPLPISSCPQVSPWPDKIDPRQTPLHVVNISSMSNFRNYGHLIIHIKTIITSDNDLKYQNATRAVYSVLIFKMPWGNRNATATKLLLLKSFSDLSRIVSNSCHQHRPSDTRLRGLILSGWNMQLLNMRWKFYLSETWCRSETMKSDLKSKVWSLARMITRVPCWQTTMIQVVTHWPDNTQPWAGTVRRGVHKKKDITLSIWFLGFSPHYCRKHSYKWIAHTRGSSWSTSFVIFTPKLPAAHC